MNIMPSRREHGWPFYMPMAYFGFFFLQPILEHAGWREWLFTALGTILFLVLYLGVHWLENKSWQLAGLGVMVLVGAAYAPFNGGASCFFIFAAALLPYILETDLAVLGLIAAILAVAGLETWWLHLSGWFLFYSGALSVVVGGTNIYFAQRSRMYQQLKIANEEIEHLAKVAERERIARDLHDVLGHTLSVIILKSLLAGKLMVRDPQRAGNEIREVEQISRQALSEVRNAIRGYRSQGLPAELAQAKSILETAGVAVECEAARIELPALHETVLSMAVREAVTNVVRHAQARTCRLRLEQQN